MKHMAPISNCRPMPFVIERPALADSSLEIKEARIANWSAIISAASDTLAFIIDLISFRGEEE